MTGLDVAMLPVESLSPHEEVDPARLEELAGQIRDDGFVREPIVVDAEHRIILDGHHRYAALKKLGLKRVPAYVVDYASDAVRVTLWDGASVDEVSKEQVVQRGVSGDRFPPKTTRHVFDPEMPRQRIPLDELRDP